MKKELFSLLPWSTANSSYIKIIFSIKPWFSPSNILAIKNARLTDCIWISAALSDTWEHIKCIENNFCIIYHKMLFHIQLWILVTLQLYGSTFIFFLKVFHDWSKNFLHYVSLNEEQTSHMNGGQTQKILCSTKAKIWSDGRNICTSFFSKWRLNTYRF